MKNYAKKLRLGIFGAKAMTVFWDGGSLLRMKQPQRENPSLYQSSFYLMIESFVWNSTNTLTMSDFHYNTKDSNIVGNNNRKRWVYRWIGRYILTIRRIFCKRCVWSSLFGSRLSKAILVLHVKTSLIFWELFTSIGSLDWMGEGDPSEKTHQSQRTNIWLSKTKELKLWSIQYLLGDSICEASWKKYSVLYADWIQSLLDHLPHSFLGFRYFVLPFTLAVIFIILALFITYSFISTQ